MAKKFSGMSDKEISRLLANTDSAGKKKIEAALQEEKRDIPEASPPSPPRRDQIAQLWKGREEKQ